MSRRNADRRKRLVELLGAAGFKPVDAYWLLAYMMYSGEFYDEDRS